MAISSNSSCPQCGEPTRPSWRICPVCESRLKGALICHQCGSDVNDSWRRCPECEVLLVCPQCSARMETGQKACRHCQPTQVEGRESVSVFKDPVCGLEFVLLRGGSYTMGDTIGRGIKNEQPVHQVTLDDFYISRCPVTQDQWSLLMSENPSEHQHSDHPVEQITWPDACDFARKLTAAVKKNMCFMLPTEAQWEYAARSGGLEDLYAGGNDIDAVAWYAANSQGKTQAVGKKRPNALGLYDMSGNVWEWCRDTYQPDAYGRHSPQNPVIESIGEDRVIRGGSWNQDAWSARCTRRLSFKADFWGPGLGFRLVMSTLD